MFMCCFGMGPSLRCVLAPLLMLPFSVMLSSHAMAFRGVLVMLSRFVVGVLRHNTSPIFWRCQQNARGRDAFHHRRNISPGMERIAVSRVQLNASAARRQLPHPGELVDEDRPNCAVVRKLPAPILRRHRKDRLLLDRGVSPTGA